MSKPSNTERIGLLVIPPHVVLTYREMHLCSKHQRRDIAAKKNIASELIFLEDFILNVSVCLIQKYYEKLYPCANVSQYQPFF
jgi:hypothetical protein